MSNVQTIRALDATATQPSPGATTTLVRADERAGAEDGSDLHPQLQAQLKEVRLRLGSPGPGPAPGSQSAHAELLMLLQLVSAQYQTVDDERRGIVQSMRLMADEARALAHEAREQSSDYLQVILDHIKDVVLTVNEDGIVQTLNPTGERVFGFDEAEVVGQRIDLLMPKIPQIEQKETITQALQRLAASSGDTQ